MPELCKCGKPAEWVVIVDDELVHECVTCNAKRPKPPTRRRRPRGRWGNYLTENGRDE